MLARSNARLIAVQAIFQYYFSKQNINTIVKEFYQFRLEENSNYDKDFFYKIVLGVDEKKETIETYIKKSLSEKWMLDRLDYTMRAIISLGVYELFDCNSIPKKVIINEYVSIASSFYDQANIGFVNGILDSLAGAIRSKDVING